MATPTMSQPLSPEDAHKYVRWSPFRSPYAIELKLALVSKLIDEIAAAERLGVEIGGLLIGWVTDSPAPTLRIEEFELVPRSTDTGPVYMLDPGERQYLAGLRAGTSARGMSAIGFFRSHLRPGPLRPSLADRSLLSGHFKDPVYAVLLIEAKEPRMGAFFLALNGQLSTEPAAQEFRFSEKALKSAGEIRPNIPGGKQNSVSEKKVSGLGARSRVGRYAVFAIIIALAVFIFSWPLWEGFLSSWDRLNLSMVESGRILRITWNHDMIAFSRGSDAKLVIADGTSRRVVQLGPDELRSGSVDYERRTGHVQATLTLNMPGSTPVNESIEWDGNQ